MKFISVYATDEQLELCKKFAMDCYELRKKVYARRGQNNPNQIINQISTSKLFEFMVYNLMVQSLPSYVEVSSPSLELYEVPAFDADLQLRLDDNIMNLNIKSQDRSSVERYGLSWVFQQEDKLFKKKKHEILILGDFDGMKGRIVAIDFVENFIPHLGPMKVANLNSNKIAIYHDPKYDCFNPTKMPISDLILE